MRSRGVIAVSEKSEEVRRDPGERELEIVVAERDDQVASLDIPPEGVPCGFELRVREDSIQLRGRVDWVEGDRRGLGQEVDDVPVDDQRGVLRRALAQVVQKCGEQGALSKDLEAFLASHVEVRNHRELLEGWSGNHETAGLCRR